jgi:hypothetical protein
MYEVLDYPLQVLRLRFFMHFFTHSICVVRSAPVSIPAPYRHLVGRTNYETLQFTVFSSLRLFLLLQVQIFFFHPSVIKHTHGLYSILAVTHQVPQPFKTDILRWFMTEEVIAFHVNTDKF